MRSARVTSTRSCSASGRRRRRCSSRAIIPARVGRTTSRAATATAPPGAVAHLAAQAVPPLAARDPVSAVRVNVLGTATLLAALDSYPEVRLVMASSADVYGAPDSELVDERAPLRPAPNL